MRDTFAPMFAALLECRNDDPHGVRSDDFQTIAARHGVDPIDLCNHWDAIRPDARPEPTSSFNLAGLRFHA